MTVRRGPSARDLLRIRWEYPVYTPPAEAQPGKTVAKAERRALSREEALRTIAGDDPRPLLVLRECMVCNGTDDALLKGGPDNEQTSMLALWFHCVKLPVEANQKDHPFYNLFELDVPEHLFVALADGASHEPLESQTSRTELWKSMREVLAQAYKQTPESAVKQITRILDKLDLADQRWNDLTARRDDLLEQEGPDSKGLPKLQKELDQVQAEREKLRASLVKVSALELRPQAEPAPAGG